MKKFFYLFTAIAALLTVACNNSGEDDGTGGASLSASPLTLNFEASGNSSQDITVTAKNVEWKHEISASGKEWITVTVSDNKLIVSVSDNFNEEQRTGTVTLKAVDNITIKTVGVTVVQKGATEGQKYELTVSPASLDFQGEGAEAQEITVTTNGEGLSWTAAPEKDATWIHASANGDKIVVTVDDNPDTTPRAAMLIVTPDKESVSPKSVKIEQAGKILVPSLTVTPSDGLSFDFRGEAEQILTVDAVLVEWGATSSDGKGNKVPWIHATAIEANMAVAVRVDRNNTLEPRSGYVVVTSNVPSVPEVRIAVTQEAGLSSISTLTAPVEVADMEPAGGFWYHIFPAQMWDNEVPCTEWSLELWGSGVTRTDNNGQYSYSGSGTRFKLTLFSERIQYNYDEEFAIPEGEYIITYNPSTLLADYAPYTVSRGEETTNLDYPSGSWYMKMENGVYTESAPLWEGKLTVSRDADEVYTFTFDFVDDAGYTITGVCSSPVTGREVSFFEDPEPTPDPNPNPDPDPDPGFPTV